MAAALVGGSFLSAFLQVLFSKLASREVVRFFNHRNLNQRLSKLKTALISVNAVLDDAEEKQITKPAVKFWLDELKDAVYEADDLLDLIAYKASSRKYQVRDFFASLNPFRTSVEEKLGDVFERVEYLVRQKEFLGLSDGIGENPSSLKVPTTSLVDESGVFGRDGDKEAIMELLLCGVDSSNDGDPGVIPIVGMGGVGKTTLAQLVYNDSRVIEWFNLRAWVYVSGEFDVFKITKDIIEEVTEGNCCTKTPNQLQLELKRRLMGKRFLIVLDDIWNDKCTDWEILQRPLKSGAQGSKIIVTTRNESISSVLRTFPPHHLKELNDDYCWLLFVKHAFDGGNSSVYPELEVIGKEIVRKCNGLPLAAKALGILLHPKRDVEEWKKILESNLWDLTNNNILPALRLSYHYLPSHLKRCFAYCAIFPKDYEFKKEELVLLWMAEGLLVHPEGSGGLEEVGDQYFDDLLSRSFFQRSSVNSSCFVMHDLMNELAKYVSGEFCLVLDGGDARKIRERVRHLSYERRDCDAPNKVENIREAKLLRSFLVLGSSTLTDHEVSYDSLIALKRLRVLSLPHCNMVGLPDSIGDLKHLRYLNFAATSIRKLPDVVGTLYNLQTIILFQCKKLVELPVNMRRLINLYHVDIRGTNLQGMPAKMSMLTNLQKLTDFFVGKQYESSVKELSKLKHLQGKLCIWNLQNVTDAQDALEANLKGKPRLKKLEFRWMGDTKNSLHQRFVLEQLHPHTNVESLLVCGYGGNRFPDWVSDSSFSSITSLVLSDCKYCSSLPPLGQLASLRDLSIIGFEGMMVVNLDFYGSSEHIKPFRSLRVLRFERMPHWCEWNSNLDDDEGGAFPLLQELFIIKCPNLTRGLPNHLPSLTTLKIEGCQQLMVSILRAPNILKMDLTDDFRDVFLEKLPSGPYRLTANHSHSVDSLIRGMGKEGGLSTAVGEIEIIDCQLLTFFPLQLFPELYIFRVSKCPNLQSFHLRDETKKDLTCLASLEIRECPNLVSFPIEGSPAPNLTQLVLWDCSNLKSLPECMPSLFPSLLYLEIGNCPELESFPKAGLPRRLESLDIESCIKLVACCNRMQWDLQILENLSRFKIGRHDDMESFPGNMLLPSNLVSLGIWNLQNLKSLDYKGLQHLTSLKELVIWDCPNLLSVPEEGLPSSLTSLCIWKCPFLKRRCEHEKGEDWPKISHIPYIEIDSMKSSSVKQKTKRAFVLPQLKC